MSHSLRIMRGLIALLLQAFQDEKIFFVLIRRRIGHSPSDKALFITPIEIKKTARLIRLHMNE